LRLKADRRLLIAGGIAVSVILCILLINVSLSSKNDLVNLKAQQKELLSIKDEFLSLKNRIDTVENKKSLTKIEGIVQAADEVFMPLGLKRKVKSVKPTGTKDLKETIEEEAEIQVEKVDMNEMVNIFHKIENLPMILSIKKTTIKTSFENPTLLDITMTIALVKPK
jgi:general secretion pathway protein M